MRGVGCVDIGVVFVTVWMVCVGGRLGGQIEDLEFVVVYW